MEEDIVLVCRKSKISMQEGREVEGKSVTRLNSNEYLLLVRLTVYIPLAINRNCCFKTLKISNTVKYISGLRAIVELKKI